MVAELLPIVVWCVVRVWCGWGGGWVEWGGVGGVRWGWGEVGRGGWRW